MGGWKDSDTANHSGDSSSKVAEAGHDFRDHATEMGVFERGNSARNSERFSQTDSYAEEGRGLLRSILGALFSK